MLDVPLDRTHVKIQLTLRLDPTWVRGCSEGSLTPTTITDILLKNKKTPR